MQILEQTILHILDEVTFKNLDFPVSCTWQKNFQLNSFNDSKVGFFYLVGFFTNIICQPDLHFLDRIISHD
jgi:hypothetical protein